MAFKIIILVSALVAATNAGLLGAPLAAAPLGYARAAPLGYAAPLSYASPLGYAAPITHAAPLAIAHAAPVAVAHSAPIAVAHSVVGDEYDPNPQYQFGYSVEDALTGDSKNQVESRNGDVVQGSYSLTDPDGTRRTVEYTADSIHGFNAVVHKTPLVQKAIVAKVAAPLAYAAPAPILHAAPAAYAQLGAPLVRSW